MPPTFEIWLAIPFVLVICGIVLYQQILGDGEKAEKKDKWKA